MNPYAEEKLNQTIWVAKSLFERGKVAGSAANISVRDGELVYISGSGTCFGTLKKSDFAVVNMEGRHIEGPKPSKELPLHLMMYEKSGVEAVIHTHSFYATLWSCLKHEDTSDVFPSYTPYLRMKVGKIGVIPYAAPGSEELFQNFRLGLEKSDGYLLQNHGIVVGGKNILDAFYGAEELEETARTAWKLRRLPAEEIHKIQE